MLPSKSTQAQVYTNLKNARLISIGQLRDSNWLSLFTKRDVTIFNSDKNTVFNGTRKTYDGLWDITIESSHPEPPLTATITKHADSILRLDKTRSELASYLHSATGYPTKSTFIQAINNGNFITWPGLTLKLISKHFETHLQTPTSFTSNSQS